MFKANSGETYWKGNCNKLEDNHFSTSSSLFYDFRRHTHNM